jgi:hypothetical protein
VWLIYYLIKNLLFVTDFLLYRYHAGTKLARCYKTMPMYSKSEKFVVEIWN